MPCDDVFRPRTDPARSLYDTFQEEAAKRWGRPYEEWGAAELKAVWTAARDYAQAHGLRVPLMEEIEAADQSAMGYIDYGAKLAYRVVECMRAEGSE